MTGGSGNYYIQTAVSPPSILVYVPASGRVPGPPLRLTDGEGPTTRLYLMPQVHNLASYFSLYV